MRMDPWLGFTLARDSWSGMNTEGRYFYTSSFLEVFLRRAKAASPVLWVQPVFTATLVRRTAGNVELPSLPLQLSFTINADCVWGRKKKADVSECVCARAGVCVPYVVSQRLSFLIKLAWAAQVLAIIDWLIRTLRMDMWMKASWYGSARTAAPLTAACLITLERSSDVSSF